MVLLSVQNLSLAYGGPKLLSQTSFEIRRGERVCLTWSQRIWKKVVSFDFAWPRETG